jgi:dTDP-4-dehydrorhamnose 3,5-epimerase
VKILETQPLALEGVHLVVYARFQDPRGYFTETFRRSDFDHLSFLSGTVFRQCNESYSRQGVVRGLHFQWDPPMGKLVRTVQGRMIDLVLDVRKGSPTFGRAIAVDLPADPEASQSSWIWVPAGFAHGNAFPEPTTIEYFCTAEYNPDSEGGISPLSPEINWSLCNPDLFSTVRGLLDGGRLSERDRDAPTLAQWAADPRSEAFVYRPVP